MQKELLNQTLDLFDTPEKWYAFIEMANQKESMKMHYFKKVSTMVYKYFMENPVKGWVCETWNNHNLELRWYLEDFGKNSLALGIGWWFQFVLHLTDTNSFDTNKINELLKTDYAIFLSKFDRIDRQFEQNCKIVEDRNYVFNSPYDYNFNESQVDYLAWFAGNQTDKFAEQIIRKVEVFRQNENLTKMLYELNQRAQIIKA